MIIENFLNILNSIIPFLVILTILVFVHELGHYSVARLNNVKVEVFSIGFGKELFGFDDKNGTRWKFSLIPLGGYVKMHGDADEASSKQQKDSVIDKKASFHHKTLGQRSAILFAGPAANYLFSFILLIFMGLFFGAPSIKPVITEVIPGYGAAEAGLLKNDLILKINNRNIYSFQELQKQINSNNNNNVNITLSRNDKIMEFDVSVQDGKIGVKGGNQEFKKLNFFQSIVYSAEKVYFFTVATLKGVYEMITGTRGTEDLGGPIRIAELSSDFWSKGFQSTMWFMILISLNLGLINLFPIPLLDGGHLMFNLIEFIKGSPLDKKSLELLHNLGFILLISLMLFATYNDILRFLD